MPGKIQHGPSLSVTEKLKGARDVCVRDTDTDAVNPHMGGNAKALIEPVVFLAS